MIDHLACTVGLAGERKLGFGGRAGSSTCSRLQQADVLFAFANWGQRTLLRSGLDGLRDNTSGIFDTTICFKFTISNGVLYHHVMLNN